jgi:3-deoxy-D-manno-octulosonic-acid transferase
MWRMILFVYNIVFAVAFVLYLPFMLLKLRRRGGVTKEYWQRFGRFAAEEKARLAKLEGPVWIHACSVGETVAALTFIRRWQEREPEAKIVLSTTTTTGHALAAKKKPDSVELIYCPIDFYPFVRGTLRAVKPSLIVIFEVEIWPNLILQAKARGIPLALANGRMSDKSSRGYAKHRWLFRRLFGAFSSLCVQSKDDADRVRRVLDADVHVCNTMKFDQVPDTNQDEAGAQAIQAELDMAFGSGERLVFVAGSTHGGEEELMADTVRDLRQDIPALRMVLVPRHVERTPDVEDVLKARGLTYRLLKNDASGSADPVDVLIVNTTGELMNYYAAADVVFVGKSLGGNEGGHNIIEPAIFGKAILHGANMQNFRDVARIFREAKAAVELPDDAALARELRRLLADAAAREQLARRSRQVVEEQRGAIDRTLDLVVPLRRR